MTLRPDNVQQPDRLPAFSRLLVADEVPDDGLDRTIEAQPAECAAVAAEIGLPAIHELSADYEISRLSGGRLQVEGTVQASLTQICVVSLDPFDSRVSQAIEVTFAPRADSDRAHSDRSHSYNEPDRRAPGRGGSPTSRRRADPEPPVSAAPVRVVEGEADPPDPIVDGRIDLGAVAVEFLTLALDIHPRKPGVQFSDVVVGKTNDDMPSAFAALARLKDRS